MPTAEERKQALAEADEMATAPIGRRGLVAHGFSAAESRAIHRTAGNENPPAMPDTSAPYVAPPTAGRTSFGVGYGDQAVVSKRK